MDPISNVSTGVNAGTSDSLSLGYGSTLAENAVDFEASLEAAMLRSEEPNKAEALAKAAFEPLNHINQEAKSLSEYAKSAVDSGNELTPAEIVRLTVQSQKFMFHSQLTANVANRSADGVQQLFRQQG